MGGRCPFRGHLPASTPAASQAAPKGYSETQLKGEKERQAQKMEVSCRSLTKLAINGDAVLTLPCPTGRQAGRQAMLSSTSPPPLASSFPNLASPLERQVSWQLCTFSALRGKAACTEAAQPASSLPTDAFRVQQEKRLPEATWSHVLDKNAPYPTHPPQPSWPSPIWHLATEVGHVRWGSLAAQSKMHPFHVLSLRMNQICPLPNYEGRGGWRRLTRFSTVAMQVNN